MFVYFSVCASGRNANTFFVMLTWIVNLQRAGFVSHTFWKILCVCVFCAVREPDGLSLLVGPPFAPVPVATIDK